MFKNTPDDAERHAPEEQEKIRRLVEEAEAMAKEAESKPPQERTPDDVMRIILARAARRFIAMQEEENKDGEED